MKSLSKSDLDIGIRDYYTQEVAIIQSIDVAAIGRLALLLETARNSGKRIFTCGNGGSASTASHFCCDFNKNVSHGLDKKFRFECLDDNVATLTALANDIDYSDVFSIQLRNKLEKDDLLIAISGSGNSQNVLNAVDYANSHGGITVGLVGYDGGKLAGAVQHCVHIPIDNMQVVEDVHMSVDHSLMYVMSKLLNKDDA